MVGALPGWLELRGLLCWWLLRYLAYVVSWGFGSGRAISGEGHNPRSPTEGKGQTREAHCAGTPSSRARVQLCSALEKNWLVACTEEPVFFYVSSIDLLPLVNSGSVSVLTVRVQVWSPES